MCLKYTSHILIAMLSIYLLFVFLRLSVFVFSVWYILRLCMCVCLFVFVVVGARPYPSMSAKSVITEIKTGFRMPRPEHCQDELYQMMLNCWSEDPDDRLPFHKLSTKLGKLLETASVSTLCTRCYRTYLHVGLG